MLLIYFEKIFEAGSISDEGNFLESIKELLNLVF